MAGSDTGGSSTETQKSGSGSIRKQAKTNGGEAVIPPCDRCRAQKAKCFVDPSESGERQCRACIRRKTSCQWNYVYKKPGRPSRARLEQASVPPETSPPKANGTSARASEPPAAPPIASTSTIHQNSEGSTVNPAILSNGVGLAAPAVPPPPILETHTEAGPDASSIFGSTHYAIPRDGPSYILPPALEFIFSPDASGHSPWFPAMDPGPSAVSLPTVSGASETPGSEPSFQASSTAVQFVHSTLHEKEPAPSPQIEDVTTFGEFCTFLSLFMKNLHLLAPLVHKPSFAMDILHRKDKTDESFRALCFSIVTFVICECPIQTMTPLLPVEGLEALLRACMKASRTLQKRLHRRPSLNLLTSTLLDWVSVQATGRYGKAVVEVLAGEARRLLYSLKLHQAEPHEGLDFIERELCRRVFWNIYQTDKTFSLNGFPMLIHDLEGLPPLPVEIDDENIFKEGVRLPPNTPNTPAPPSFLVGFVANSRLFQIISQSIVYRRSLQSQASSIGIRLADPQAIERWVDAAFARITQIMDELPSELKVQEDESDGDWTGSTGHRNEAIGDRPMSPFGTQQANLLVTALSAEFSLLDLKSIVSPESSVEGERHRLAKRAYETLSSIPLENIASNGESMRGKVFRTILSLLNTKDDPGKLSEHVWEWWNIYSRVQFVQVIPDIPASGTVTRPASPAPL